MCDEAWKGCLIPFNIYVSNLLTQRMYFWSKTMNWHTYVCYWIIFFTFIIKYYYWKLNWKKVIHITFWIIWVFQIYSQENIISHSKNKQIIAHTKKCYLFWWPEVYFLFAEDWNFLFQFHMDEPSGALGKYLQAKL